MPVRSLRLAAGPLAVLLSATLGCREGADSPAGPELDAAPTGVADAALPPFRAVTAGGLHTCALARDGTAYCWGANGQGQVGDGSGVGRIRPTKVAGGRKFLQISAGNWHTCAVASDQRLFCWGLNEGSSGPQDVPTLVPGGHSWRNVDAGNYFTCGVRPDDIGFCWGRNSLGQLGSNSGFTAIPARISGGHRWRRVEAGGQYGCGGTTAFRVFCWGIGKGSTPTALGGGLLFRQVAVGGGDFTDAQHQESDAPQICGITQDDRAYCWGDGSGGKLGNGAWTSSSTPVPVAGSRRWRQVAAGIDNSCGVTTDRVAFCWGMNRFGTNGTGDTVTTNTPRRVLGGLAFTNITTGLGLHVCGLTGSDKIYCWGDNSAGQLGDGTRTRRLAPVAVAAAP